MARTAVSVVTTILAIVKTTLTINVTTSLSSHTWNESRSLCPLIDSSVIFSDEPFHWVPRKPASSTQLWTGGESQQPYNIAWIRFIGCFHSNLTLSDATPLSKNGDAILECSRNCSNRNSRVFYVTESFCICGDRVTNNSNVISLSDGKCNGSSCPGDRGGFCGKTLPLPRACLCKYENIYVSPPATSSSMSQTCGNTVNLDCNKCVNDGRLVCTTEQAPGLSPSKGFYCNGRTQRLHAELPLRDLKDQSDVYLYGFQWNNSRDTKLCIAWNIQTNLRISKPCVCPLKALCMYNGTLIGLTAQLKENRQTLGIGITTGIVLVVIIIVVVCVSLWTFRKHENRIKISGYIHTLGGHFGSRRKVRSPGQWSRSTSHPDRYSEETFPSRHSDRNVDMYDNGDWGSPPRDRHVTSHDNKEGHYDSTKGGDTGDVYDCLGQTDAKRRAEQRLANDYDTMAAIRAEAAVDATTVLLHNAVPETNAT